MYSERIKEIRTLLDISRPKLAKKIDIPERTIASYENGRVPSLEFLAQLYKILNVNPIWFLSGKGEIFIKNIPDNFKEEIKQTVREIISSNEFNK